MATVIELQGAAPSKPPSCAPRTIQNSGDAATNNHRAAEPREPKKKGGLESALLEKTPAETRSAGVLNFSSNLQTRP
jgi:hypothetical protein